MATCKGASGFGGEMLLYVTGVIEIVIADI
jgi:hypothetical protein